ncbi:GGDEF domain-containing protein [Neobacillus sp. SM06]|uniref:GGDEF domain-containing protein n=1 Tax=Neobacillus sp. SM06 TaxID=3422492 RepID=UPI003D29DC1D
MGSMLKKNRRQYQMYINLIRLIGVISIYLSFSYLAGTENPSTIMELAAISVLFLLFSPFLIVLPSGASFRPGMAFILFSFLHFDYRLAVLTALPGTIASVFGKKEPYNKFFLMIGHLSIGIYAAGFVYHQLLPAFSQTYKAFVIITVSLLLHFAVNRFVAAIIVAYRKQRSLQAQLFALVKDLNWGYISTYLIGVIMFLVFQTYYLPGVFLSTFLLLAVYRSFIYFQKLKLMEEKVYLDGLTKAESRLSWEEFSKRMKKNRSFPTGIVCMMDLDYFKSINDTYGHDFGDRILQEFVSYIRKEMSRKYRLFRFGGDEFILFVYVNEKECKEACEEMNQLIYQQNEIWKKKGLAVSVSFGSSFLSEKDTLENSVTKADKLMYNHKFSRNLVIRN